MESNGNDVEVALTTEEVSMSVNGGEQNTKSLGYDYRVPLDARSLAWITEEAEGTRDRNLKLVENIGLGTVRLVEEREFDPSIHHRLLDVRTDNIRADRIKLETLTMKPQGAAARDLPVGEGEWDALFWTEAAIEKFFFPYYIAQRLLDPKDWGFLRAALEDRELIAVAHFTPSRPVLVKAFDPGIAVHIEGGELTFTGVVAYVARLKLRLSREAADRGAADRGEELAPAVVGLR